MLHYFLYTLFKEEKLQRIGNKLQSVSEKITGTMMSYIKEFVDYYIALDALNKNNPNYRETVMGIVSERLNTYDVRIYICG